MQEGQKVWGRWGPAPLTGGVVTPRNTSLPVMCYYTEFGRSRSIRIGVSRVRKKTVTLRPLHLGWGTADPLKIYPSHVCYHSKFGRSG